MPPSGRAGVSVGVAARCGDLMADRAYRALRDRLVTLRIPPGSPIDEDAIGRELKMGRTPVREAIKRLALENLVTVFPRRGTFASEINITDLAHIADVRVQLERHAAYRAAERVAPAQRAQLEHCSPTSSAARHDQRALVELDTPVHRFIDRCADNPYLEETLGRYLNLSLRIWYLVIDRLPHLSARVHEQRRCWPRSRRPGRTRAEIAGEQIRTFEGEIRSVL